nr:GGDEF domain-containing protein [Kineosporia rhizophila]
MLATAAAERQRRLGPVPFSPDVSAPRRSYSLLPYAAVGAVHLLLLLDAFGPGGTVDEVVVVGAAGVTALVTVRQVSVLKENHRILGELHHSARHDGLTRLANRAYLHEQLDGSRVRPGDGELAVLLLDLNGFKQINDIFGHAAGDHLLTAVAERLRATVGPGDIVARLGGDEFVVALRGGGARAADEVAQRIVQALEQPVLLGSQALVVGVSIGIATGTALEDPDVLLRRADVAMYSAKYSAKSRPGSSYLHHRPGLSMRAEEQTAERLQA